MNHSPLPRFQTRKAWKRTALALRDFVADFHAQYGREPTTTEILAAKLPGLYSTWAIGVARRDLANLDERP